MNGQKPERKTWEEVVEELKTAYSNGNIQVALIAAQLKEAQTHLPKK